MGIPHLQFGNRHTPLLLPLARPPRFCHPPVLPLERYRQFWQPRHHPPRHRLQWTITKSDPVPVSTRTRPEPQTLSAILAASSSSSPLTASSTPLGNSTTERLYPSLTPSMSQRSTALN